MRRARLLAVLAALVVSSHAVAEPPADASEVTKDAFGSLESTDGWCVQVVGGAAAVDLWASAPGTISTVERGQIRWLTVVHGDTTDSTAPACVALGAGGVGASLTCDPENGAAGAATTAGLLPALGASRTFALRRTREAGGVTGTTPALYAAAKTGATVALCVDVGW